MLRIGHLNDILYILVVSRDKYVTSYYYSKNFDFNSYLLKNKISGHAKKGFYNKFYYIVLIVFIFVFMNILCLVKKD